MGKEIERKFLVNDFSYRQLAEGILYRQGYLSRIPERIIRVRTCGDKGFITVKSRTIGITRLEYEYEIPLSDANEMLEFLCEKPIIEKNRYKCDIEGHVWEIDEFLKENEGLVVAEIELQDEKEVFSKPLWLGEEVSNDPRYKNSNLIRYPFKSWKSDSIATTKSKT